MENNQINWSEDFQAEIQKSKLAQDLHHTPDEDIFKAVLINRLKDSESKESFEKGFGKDLQKQFPNGGWRTINGARVFINGGKVVAGLDNFNGMIDDFFKEKKEKDSKPKTLEKVMSIFINKIEKLNAVTTDILNSKESNIEFAKNFKVETKEKDGVSVDFLIDKNNKVIASRVNDKKFNIKNDYSMTKENMELAYNDFDKWLNM